MKKRGGFRVTGGGAGTGGGAVGGFTDTFSLDIRPVDANAAPTDAATFRLNLAQSDANAAPSEAVRLAMSGSQFQDASAAPTDAKSILMRIWLSGCTSFSQVTNPSNANGQNNGTIATIQTQVAGANQARMDAVLGANVPSGITVTSAIYRGWFKSVNVLVTSDGQIVVDWSGGATAVFNNSASNTTVDHLGGTFTYDLFAAGLNTLAKLQSITNMRHFTNDAAAGVTPHILTVDAGCIEIAGAFS